LGGLQVAAAEFEEGVGAVVALGEECRCVSRRPQSFAEGVYFYADALELLELNGLELAEDNGGFEGD
jgi:hypothetical protein